MDEFIFPYEKFNKNITEYFGEMYVVEKVERILGGAQKYVYKVTTQEGFIFVIYIWHGSTSYFCDSENKDIFTSSSAELFEINNKYMLEHGVSTPKLYYMNRTEKEFPFKYAYVEYIEGLDMDIITEKYPERIEKSMSALKMSLNKMHDITNKQAGALNYLQPEDFSTVTYAFKVAKENLNYLIKNDFNHKKLYEKADRILDKLYGEVEECGEYSFIHFELGPNHVIVDDSDTAYLIDIEGAKFFDIEMEYSFLQMRFGENYKYLKRNNLNLTKMKFYLLWHYIGNISGACELLEKNYYDIDEVKGMIGFLREKLQEFCECFGD